MTRDKGMASRKQALAHRARGTRSNGTSTGGNHKSHCASSPGAYSVRDAGSGGKNNGRNNRTRSFSNVIDRSDPNGSAITVAGIVGTPR